MGGLCLSAWRLQGAIHTAHLLMVPRQAGNEDDEALLPASKGSASAAEPLETETIAYVVDAMQDRRVQRAHAA